MTPTSISLINRYMLLGPYSQFITINHEHRNGIFLLQLVLTRQILSNKSIYKEHYS